MPKNNTKKKKEVKPIKAWVGIGVETGFIYNEFFETKKKANEKLSKYYGWKIIPVLITPITK